MDKLLSASVVPPRFRNSALLTGHVPHKSLASEPRVSYALYVPEKIYNQRHPDVGEPGPNKLPLLVAVHGTRRDVFNVYDLVPFAESTPCAILLPLFPIGLDGPNDVDSYKLLKSKTLRPDLALLSILDEVAIKWPAIETNKIFLMGFSGGGQFSHRFLYLYPERLAAVSIGAPGRTTSLDEEKSWPSGIKDAEEIFGRTINKELIKKVPIHLIVGDQDTSLHGDGEFWAWVKQYTGKAGGEDTPVNNEHGVQMIEQGRLKTTHELQDSWKALGIESQFDIVPGVAHNARGVRSLVLQYLQPLIRKQDGK
ncbi:alpha/beta-hydrolase [Daldinia caldariorum]|uniref:alpha/beta-hydrolase n=1 Tax=Daldinia caldariorum TaxID=326644 RepID=UPI0020076768|nr:alpha/beta-hydrolase [Daldinia caldariorum]KAI1464242.1 alpha/beta-hydrolase [Daldinia caldariorum]